MKIEATVYLGELAIDVTLQTRTLVTHSQMQQLTNANIGEIKGILRRAGDDCLEVINETTISRIA